MGGAQLGAHFFFFFFLFFLPALASEGVLGLWAREFGGLVGAGDALRLSRDAGLSEPREEAREVGRDIGDFMPPSPSSSPFHHPGNKN